MKNVKALRKYTYKRTDKKRANENLWHSVVTVVRRGREDASRLCRILEKGKGSQKERLKKLSKQKGGREKWWY